MRQSLLELDPQADALLTLQRPNLQQVRSPTDQESPAQQKTGKASKLIQPKTREEMVSMHPFLENGDPNEIEFRVSAKHLCLASPVFKRMIQGDFKESKPNSEGLLEIKTSDWNAEALLIVLDIIHGHHNNVPDRLKEDIVAQIGLIVDYYDCLEVVQIFFGPSDLRIEGWLSYSHWASRESFAEEFGANKTLLLFSAWAFRSEPIFKSLTSSAILNRSEPIETHLPVPTQILEKINSRRVEIIDQQFSQLYNLQEGLISGRVGCQLECSCRLLGYLMKQMRERNVPREKPKNPFLGYSVISLAKTIAGIKTPDWQSFMAWDACKIEKSLGLYRDEKDLVFAVPGLDLKDFQ